MNILDIILLIPLLWAGFKGFKNGFVNELFSVAALIIGIYITYKFSDYIAELLPDIPAIGIIAFLITFIGVVVSIHFIGHLFEKIVKIATSNFFNRLLGICFGILKVLFICSIILHFIHTVDRSGVILRTEPVEQSLLYPYVEKSASFIINFSKSTYWK